MISDCGLYDNYPFNSHTMFLDKSQIIVQPLSDGAMVSQMVWLGMKDVFTQIAKDVVGQGLDRRTLTFKVMLVYDRP